MYNQKELIQHFYKNDIDSLTHGYGIKIETVDEHNSTIVNEFICGICLNLVWDPHECATCYQLFCKQCITKWLEESEEGKCPNRCAAFENELNQKLRNILSTLRIICPNKKEGCEEKISYENYLKHLKECDYSVFRCLGEGCTFMSKKEEIKDHVMKCEYLYEVCRFCLQSFLRNQINDHISNCQLKFIKEESISNEIQNIRQTQNQGNHYQELLKDSYKRFGVSQIKNDPFNLEIIRTKQEEYLNFISQESSKRKILDEIFPDISDFDSNYYSLDNSQFSKFANIIRPNIKILNVINLIPALHDTIAIGTNKVEDLMTKNKETGLCSEAPGNLIFELNKFYHFNEIEVSSVKSINNWNFSYGNCSLIYVSQDGTNWKEVGILPADFTSKIIKVKVLRSLAKFIRFTNDTRIGISYLNILPLNYEYYDIRPLMIADYAFSGEYLDGNNEVIGSININCINGLDKEYFYSKGRGYLLIELKFPKNVNNICIVSPHRNKTSKDVCVSVTGTKDSWNKIGSFEDRNTFILEGILVKFIKIICQRAKDPLGITLIDIK